jgi:hypothetical protein
MDEENCIEYVFSEFDEELLPSKKIELIKKHGKPRKRPLNGRIETDRVKIELQNPIWELQVIHKLPEDLQ